MSVAGSVRAKAVKREKKNTVFPNDLRAKVSCKMKGDPVPAGADRCEGKTPPSTTLQEQV